MSEEQVGGLMSLLLQEKRNAIRAAPQPRHILKKPPMVSYWRLSSQYVKQSYNQDHSRNGRSLNRVLFRLRHLRSQ